MKSQFSLDTRLSLALSLAIVSCLVANVARAESQQPTGTSVTNLSHTIAKLIDLDPSSQDLVTSALNRAIASKEYNIGTVKEEIVKSSTTGVTIAQRKESRPIINGKIQNHQPSPSPMINGTMPAQQPTPIINGRIRNPQSSPSPLINGIMVKPQK
jgi:hypothetical protein